MNSRTFPAWCAVMFTLILACIISNTVAQELLVEWQQSRYGEVITLPKHMTVVPATGERYVIAEDGRELRRLIKYDGSGEIMWSLSYSGMAAQTIVHRAGAVYVFGKTHIAGPAMSIVKFNDLATRGEVAWQQDFSYSLGNVESRAMIADPVGDGVIITGEARFDDPPRMGLFRVLKTIRIFPDGTSTAFTDFNLGPFAAGAELGPRAMCSDEAGNIYITGMADGIRRPDRPYDASDGYVSPSSLFVIKYDATGNVVWIYKSPAGPSEYGYDIEVDESGVYVLGQSAPAHYNMPEPLRVGNMTLRKLDPSTGSRLVEVLRPARIREYPRYLDLNSQREGLVLAPDHGGVYVTYDGADDSSVKFERYNTSLEQQWSRDLSVGAETHFTELIRLSGTHFAVGLNNKIVEGTEAVVDTYTADNRLVDQITLNGIALTQIQPDANNKIHVAGLSTNIFGSRSAYEAKVGFSPYYPIVPMQVSVTDHLLWNLDRIIGLYWEFTTLSWSGSSTPGAPGFMASMSDQNGGWKEIFTKPATIALPKSQDFNPFALSVKGPSGYQPIFELEGNLPENGLKSLEIGSDWKERTLSVSIETDGANVPVILSVIGSDGKVLGEQTMLAPGKQIFSDRFKEPVTSIRFSTPAKLSSISFYPNPSNGQFKITLDKSIKLPALFTVHDGQGTKVHQQLLFSASTEIAINAQTPGLYVARVTSSQGIVTNTIQIK